MKKVAIISLLGLLVLSFNVLRAQINFNAKDVALIQTDRLCFTENQGQCGEMVLFKAETNGAVFYLCRDEVGYLFVRNTDELLDDDFRSENDSLQFENKSHHPHYKQEALLVKAQFVGANPNAQVVGVNRLSYNYNYFIGNDPSRWHTDVPNYSSVVYEDIYPGIDLRYHGNKRSLKYDFIIHPGADIGQIRIRYSGVANLAVTSDGDLQANTDWGPIYEKAPYIYQELNGAKQEITGRYESIGSDVFGFAIDAGYDPDYPLVIDPELVYSTYLGTQYVEYANDIAVDSEHNMYITGYHSANIFPQVDPYDDDVIWGDYMIVTKISSSGDSLLYSSMIGSSYMDEGSAIAVDNLGYAYIAGLTESTDFPLVNPIDNVCDGLEAFVLKLSPAGNALVYSTYLGGANDEICNDIACDISGNAYVIGRTQSHDFPTFNALYDQSFGYRDAFVAKINTDGTALVYSTYLGSSGGDSGGGIAADADGNTYITGLADESNFPVTDNFDHTFNGDGDAFVAKISPDGGSLVYSNFLGGSGGDFGVGIAVDAEGYVYVTGETESTDFPLLDPYNGVYVNHWDIFLAKFSPDGNSLLYSTLWGGDLPDNVEDLAVDENGNAYMAGYSGSEDIPMVNAFYPNYIGGFNDVIFAKVSTISGCMLFSTYWGGTNDDLCYGIAADNDNGFYIVGETRSVDMPVFDPFDSTANGGPDCFIAKFHIPENTIESGNVYGTVTDGSANYIEGVTVQVEGISLQDISNSSGAYSLNPICPGRYHITFSHDFYYDTTISDIEISEGESVELNVVMTTGGFLTGTVSDTGFVPLEDVQVSIVGLDASTTTDSVGEYMLTGICPGSYDVAFSREYYADTIITDVSISSGDTTTLDLTLLPEAHYVILCYGNPDLSPVNALIGGTVYVDVYLQTHDAASDMLGFSLAVPDEYFDCYTAAPDVQIYYPLSEWDAGPGSVDIYPPFNSAPSPEGFSSLSMLCFAWETEPPWGHGPWLSSDVPIRVASFGISVANDQGLAGDTLDCLASGQLHGFPEIDNFPWTEDTLGMAYYATYEHFSPVTFESTNIPYVPGDANMIGGIWPPQVIGGDVTYLVGYFRSINQACQIGDPGFYCSADANGDCQVIGSDVTRMVSYFRGLAQLSYCPDYPPRWLTPNDCPADMPSGWPGCE